MQRQELARGLGAPSIGWIRPWLCTLAIALGGQTALAGEDTAFEPGRLLVKFKGGVKPERRQAILARNAADIRQEIAGIGVLVLDLPTTGDELARAEAFRALPEVEFAELDHIAPPADGIPNDPRYPFQPEHGQIGSPAAWAITTGAQTVILAILDTGVDGNHPDLVGNLVPGWNAYNGNSNTNDVHGHGTFVAGVAGAVGNNGEGIAGTAWSCKVMPIRISAQDGTGSWSAITEGLVWAADHGARVANISYYSVSTSSSVTTAAQYFQAHGGVVTAAAGNTGQFESHAENPFVLTASAVSLDDTVPTWSTTGNYIDLGAPASGETLVAGGGYGHATGTSVACAYVAGVAGLVLSANPDLTAVQVQNVITQSAVDLGPPGWDPSFGWGRLDAGAAVQLAFRRR